MTTHTTNGCLSNLAKWRHFTDGLISPDSFIDFGFYYLIAASLQRRVWVGPKHKPLFPNIYPVFVSDPGIGKGLVIQEVSKMLRYHKLNDPNETKTVVTGNQFGLPETRQTGYNPVIEVDRKAAEEAAMANYLSGKAEEERLGLTSFKHSTYEKPLLIPVAADSTTFEALVSSMGRALRRINYSEYDPSVGRNLTKIYTHSSLCFCLEEISSLFRKKAEDVANFLQITYDCGDYKKDTKTQGVDKIYKCCLNFLGGTQPAFMRRSFSDGLLNEGFASRAWFIYAARNRKVAMHIPELNDFQKQCEGEILLHIKKLTSLYGGVSYTDEAFAFLEDWWAQSQILRPNLSEKLLHYYSRKNIHVQKLALAIHFADTSDISLPINIDECKLAIKMLAGIERRMHHAILTKSENPYYHLGLKIIKFLEEVGPKTRNELLARFWEDCPGANPKESLDQCLEHYQIMGRINQFPQGNKQLYGVIRKEEDNSEITE